MALVRVPKLEDICLRSVAFNLARHGQLKKETQDEKVCARYSFLGRFFQKQLMDILMQVYQSGIHDKCERRTRNIIQRLFRGILADDKIVEFSSTFLFNENTASLCFDFSNSALGLSGLLYQKAVSLCKQLKSMTIKNFDYRHELLTLFTYGNNLAEVDMLYSCVDNHTVASVFKNCISLVSFKAGGSLVTFAPLYIFCKCSEDTTLQCDGNCCNVGKKLQVLVLYTRSTSPRAAASALLHLHSLRIFRDDLCSYSWHVSAIASGVDMLHSVASESGNPIRLKLEAVHFPTSVTLQCIHKVLSLCPRMKSITCDITTDTARLFTLNSFNSLKAIHLSDDLEITMASEEFQNLLKLRGSQLEYICLSAYERLNVKHIADILCQCKNLKNLSLHSLMIFSEKGEDDLLDDRNFPTNLEEISLVGIRPQDETVSKYFCMLLSVSKKLKNLSVSGASVQQAFVSAAKRESFPSLEEICTDEVFTEKASLESLIHPGSKLKKIVFFQCRSSTSSPSDYYHRAALKCNMLLHIDALSCSVHDDYFEESLCLSHENNYL